MQRQLAGLEAELVAPTAVDDPDRVALQEQADNLRAAIGPATALAATFGDLRGTEDEAAGRRATIVGELQDARDLLQQTQVLPSVIVQRVAVEHSNLRSAVVQVL